MLQNDIFSRSNTQTYPVTLVFNSRVLFTSCQLMSCLRMDLNKETRSLLVWRHAESCNDTEEIAVATNTTIPTTSCKWKTWEKLFRFFFVSNPKFMSLYSMEFVWLFWWHTKLPYWFNVSFLFVTARKQSCGKVMFSQVSVCSHGGKQIRPEGIPPSPDAVNQRAVRILLECILV